MYSCVLYAATTANKLHGHFNIMPQKLWYTHIVMYTPSEQPVSLHDAKYAYQMIKCILKVQSWFSRFPRSYVQCNWYRWQIYLKSTKLIFKAS